MCTTREDVSLCGGSPRFQSLCWHRLLQYRTPRHSLQPQRASVLPQVTQERSFTSSSATAALSGW